jgi:hypothetical protein
LGYSGVERASCSLRGGLTILIKKLRIFWCGKGFMLLTRRIKYTNKNLGYSGVERVSCSLLGGLNIFIT